MKKLLLLGLLHFSFAAANAQVYRDRIGFDLESIADIDIGWIKIYKYTTPPAPKVLGKRTFSAVQTGYIRQLVEWMQQSYNPRGCLGNAGYYGNQVAAFSNTNSKLGNAINSQLDALPQLYGAYSKIYMFLKKDDQGKFTPQNNLAEHWNIEANGIKEISLPVSFISSSDEYYFVLPDFETHPRGYENSDKAASDYRGFRNNKNIAAYKHFYIPPKIIDDYPHYVVIMTKNNELPFEKVTIGEFFTQAEKQLPYWQDVEPVPADKFATAQKNLARLKAKYKSKWNEVAQIKLSGTDINLYTFINATEGYEDMFEGSEYTFPVMKVKPGTRELCKTDVPQWLVLRWTTGMPNQAFNVHLHESILNNFNYEYAYNFFFYPEKVKGHSYKPLRSPLVKEPAAITESSITSKQNATDASVAFFEDFSSTPIGKKPNGWNTPLANGGTSATIVKPEGLDGNWAALRGNNINCTLKKPLSGNFTMIYDVVASEEFTWGAKGLTMKLSKETASGNAGPFMQIRLRPGFDGRDGETTVELEFPSSPGYANNTKWYKAPGFSNDKKVNRVTVTIKIKDEVLQVFIDKTKIAEYAKGVPAAIQFNALSFDCAGNTAENDTFFISNIKISKD